MAGGPDNITKGLIGGLDEIVPSGLVDILTVIGQDQLITWLM